MPTQELSVMKLTLLMRKLELIKLSSDKVLPMEFVNSIKIGFQKFFATILLALITFMLKMPQT